jgi:pimeloyl-ACP methyl ester carboxylesterase
MQQLMPVGQDEVWVEDSEGAGPVVLLLHPGIADSRAWDAIWPALTERCRVIRFDVRAYGRSPVATQDYTIVDDALAVLDHLGVASAHLVGCSMGGGASMDLTVHHPERVLSLTLLCPGVNGYDWPDEPELEAEWEALVSADDQEGLFQFGMRLWAAAGPDPVVESLMRDAGEAQANEEQFQRKVEPTFDRLGEIDVPTLMVVGDVDNPTLVAADLAAAQLIPRCRLVTMPGVDHLPMLREPEWTLRLILEQVGAAGGS